MFDDLSENDELELGNVAWHEVDTFIKRVISTIKLGFIVKLNEDVVLGAFIITKLGKPSLALLLEQRILNENINRFKGKSDLFDVDQIAARPDVDEYIQYCLNEGIHVALSGKIGGHKWAGLMKTIA